MDAYVNQTDREFRIPSLPPGVFFHTGDRGRGCEHHFYGQYCLYW